MFTLIKPSPKRIQRFINDTGPRPYCYPMVGATQGKLPADYIIDHNRRRLGFGLETFEQAKAALGRWEMFQLGWVQPCWPDTPIEEGATVGILAHALGLWSLNACRIVYIFEEEEPVAKFGFAYGTLPGHLARGEERFTIEWHQADDSVWYDILAFSQPHHILAKLGYPAIRRMQKRFARESMASMERSIKSQSL